MTVIEYIPNNFIVADNNQREASIARMTQQLAQMKEIISAHNGAQPDSPLFSLLEEMSQPDVSNVLSSNEFWS